MKTPVCYFFEVSIDVEQGSHERLSVVVQAVSFADAVLVAFEQVGICAAYMVVVYLIDRDGRWCTVKGVDMPYDCLWVGFMWPRFEQGVLLYVMLNNGTVPVSSQVPVEKRWL